MTRTGHRYNQIPETHAETEVKERGETSRKYVSSGHTVTSSETAEQEKDGGNVEADSSESRAKDDVIIKREQRDKEQKGDADAASITDVGSDQPASTEDVRNGETQLTTSSLQEVL